MGEKPSILGEPPLGAYETSPRGRFKAVGPTGRSAGLLVAPAAPNFLWWTVLGCLVFSTLVLACLEWIWCGSWATLGLIEPESSL